MTAVYNRHSAMDAPMVCTTERNSEFARKEKQRDKGGLPCYQAFQAVAILKGAGLKESYERVLKIPGLRAISNRNHRKYENHKERTGQALDGPQPDTVNEDCQKQQERFQVQSEHEMLH